jgi:GH24 family phage-related lysozyme (muramidase)
MSQLRFKGAPAGTGMLPSMTMSRAEELEDMEWECRALAAAAEHEDVRKQLLEVAEQFNRLAALHKKQAGAGRLKHPC